MVKNLSSRDNRKKKTITSVFTALVIVLVAAGFFILGYWTFVYAGNASARLVPGDAFLYASLNVDEGDEQGQLAQNLLFSGEDAKSQIIQGLMLATLGFYSTDLDIDVQKDVKPWVGKEIAFYQQEPTTESSPVYLLDIGSYSKFIKVFNRLKERTSELAGNITEEKYKRVTIVTIEDIRTASFSYFKGFLLASKKKESIASSIDAGRRDNSSMAKNEKFRALLHKIDDDSVIHGVFDLHKLVERAVETGFVKNENLKKAVKQTKDDFIAFSFKYLQEGLKIKFFTFSRFLENETFTPKLIDYIPFDVDGFIDGKDIEGVFNKVFGTEIEGGTAGEFLKGYLGVESISSLQGFNGEFVFILEDMNGDGQQEFALILEDNPEISKGDLESNLKDLHILLWNAAWNEMYYDEMIMGKEVRALGNRESGLTYYRENGVLVLSSSQKLMGRILKAEQGRTESVKDTQEFKETFKDIELSDTYWTFYFTKEGADIDTGALKTSTAAASKVAQNYMKAIGGVVKEDEGTLIDVMMLIK